ncbi:cation channel sperm-associated auxiliary subunit TMEM249 [Pantherophis guttatus]|uniref:Transmembrane protein 249 n=1 Tax=Pantherophis guttatus TaxID=94885 RepID=A0A6P9C8T0_PANGU|nr:cation channel sperm-associated auxiliary subunit TMEM249 [Pantherophis guttatus]XP_034275941.1 cation channel sperm-associated auxiliary subunit TMEM249 [Pantherophis guttatus]
MLLKSILRGPLALWYCGFVNSEEYLHQQLQENKYFPFQVQQPKVFVMEYYKDTVWKGLLCFVISVVASIFYFKMSAAYQDLSAFFIFSLVASLWVLVSNLCKRRLIINHIREYYQFYIRGILWHEGPLHQIYVRLVGQRDAHGQLFYSLIINGYRLEVLTLVHLTKNHELVDSLGRRIARYLNLNYFDSEDLSTLHVIRHFPPELDEDEDEDDSLVV